MKQRSSTRLRPLCDRSDFPAHCPSPSVSNTGVCHSPCIQSHMHRVGKPLVQAHSTMRRELLIPVIELARACLGAFTSMHTEACTATCLGRANQRGGEYRLRDWVSRILLMAPRTTATESDQGCCKDFLICCDDFTSRLPHELEPLSDGLAAGAKAPPCPGYPMTLRG